MRGWLVAVAAALWACEGVERMTSPLPDQDAVPVETDAGLTWDGGGEALPELTDPTGQWAVFIENRQCMDGLGTAIENMNWSWYLLDVRVKDGSAEGELALIHDVRLCHEELSPLLAGLRTVVPDEVPAIQPVRELSGFLLGASRGAAYVLDEITEMWGVEGLGLTDAVPTQIDDERVVDEDEDGHPGVSFMVANQQGEAVCEVHVAERKRLRLRGEVQDSRRIEGNVWGEVDQVVLEATSPLCASHTQFVASLGESRFVMARVDGRQGGLRLDLDESGAVDCGELIDALDAFMGFYELERATPDNRFCQTGE